MQPVVASLSPSLQQSIYSSPSKVQMDVVSHNFHFSFHKQIHGMGPPQKLMQKLFTVPRLEKHNYNVRKNSTYQDKRELSIDGHESRDVGF